MARDRIDVKLEGAEELIEELRALGVNVKRSVRGAVRAGAKVIQEAAEANARGVTGSSGKHVRIKVSARSKEFVEAEIGATKKKFQLPFFETGVQPHEITGSPLVFEGDKGLIVIGGVRHPGMPAQPWLRPALDVKRDAAVEAMGETLRAAIEEARIAAEGQDDAE
jgi:HK97 gp10 family phage protein